MARRITPLRDLATTARLSRWLRKVRPDIVDAHTPKGGLLGMVGAWLARVPVRVYHMRRTSGRVVAIRDSPTGLRSRCSHPGS
jgi:hypothetical protein